MQITLNKVLVFAAVLAILFLLLFFYMKDQPVRDVAWEHLEDNNWHEASFGKWVATVSQTVATDEYELYEPSYEGQAVLRVEFFGENTGLNGIPDILVDKEFYQVVGIIPME